MDIVASEHPAETAGQLLSKALARYQARPTLLLLSGGSALSTLEHIEPTTLGPQLTITTLDERHSSDPAVNNFSQIATTSFYRIAKERAAVFIDTTVSSEETLTQFGARLEQALRAWQAAHPDGVVLATIGIGADGHTAGIFPGASLEQFAGEDWVVAHTVPEAVNPYSKRVTVTYTFLRTQLTEAVVYAVGAEKREIMERLQQPGCNLQQMPACIINELPSVTVVTDT